MGLYTRADVDLIHNELQLQLAKSGAHVDKFYFCPHDKNECNCRKPRPGLFEQACGDFPNIKPSESLMVGDSLSDVELGKNLGLKTVFITSNSEHQKTGDPTASMIADATFGSLSEVLTYLHQEVR